MERNGDCLFIRKWRSFIPRHQIRTLKAVILMGGPKQGELSTAEYSPLQLLILLVSPFPFRHAVPAAEPAALPQASVPRGGGASGLPPDGGRGLRAGHEGDYPDRLVPRRAQDSPRVCPVLLRQPTDPRAVSERTRDASPPPPLFFLMNCGGSEKTHFFLWLPGILRKATSRWARPGPSTSIAMQSAAATLMPFLSCTATFAPTFRFKVSSPACH